MVESGAALTEVAIFKDGIVKEIFSIPLGGNNITSDLSICAGLSMKEAEEMKCEYSNNYKSLYNEKDEKEINNLCISYVITRCNGPGQLCSPVGFRFLRL